MSFAEPIRMTKGKVDATHQKPHKRSTHLSFGGGDHKDPARFISKPQDGNDTNNSKMANFSTADYLLNDFPLAPPSNENDIDEDDHAVPWMNCPTAEPLSHEHHELEFSTENELVMEGNLLSLEKRSNSTHVHDFGPSNSAAIVPTLGKSSHQKSPSYAKLPAPDALVPQHSGIISVDRLCATVPNIVVCGKEKNLDPQTASVCSASSSERASNDPAYDLKRKCYDTDDSKGPSIDADEESVGVRETLSYYASSKRRRRTSKVHNSSEWRWRDRVNEKMRVLQELIPNCNKADQASLLDEAIKYLHTLQLQWQSLSMGAGIYMSPMMLQAAMQQAVGAYMPQFPPVGVMGGFGMGMHDATSTMPPCFLVPNHPISTSMCQGPQSVGYSGEEHLMPMTHFPLPIFGSPSIP